MSGQLAGEAGALSLHDAAVRHGAFSWTEQRLFTLTGAWAAAPGPGDDARCALFEWSAQHAWHAQLWADRLPVLAGVDREPLVRPPSDAVATALEMLIPRPGDPRGGHGAPGAEAAGVLAVLAKIVLPGLLAAYRGHAEHLVPVADRPAARALALVLRDEVEQLRALERLSSAESVRTSGASSVGAAVARAERLLGAGVAAAARFSCAGGRRPPTDDAGPRA